MNVECIVFHCSDSPNDRGDDASDIHQWHRQKGWDGVGYHWIITGDGVVQAGRPEYWQGAHEQTVNDRSIGVCLIGLPGQFNESQMVAMVDLAEGLRERYPEAEFVNHSDLDHERTCPGMDLATIAERGIAEALEWRARDAQGDDKQFLRGYEQLVRLSGAVERAAEALEKYGENLVSKLNLSSGRGESESDDHVPRPLSER